MTKLTTFHHNPALGVFAMNFKKSALILTALFFWVCSNRTTDQKQLGKPQFNLDPGSYNQDIQVLLSMPPGESEGVIIYYTLDDTAPSKSSTVYSEPISITGHGTQMKIRMMATKEGFLHSKVITGTFIIYYNSLSRPRMSHDSGSHNQDIQVLLSMPPGESEGVIIYYTLDGTIPSESSTVYSEPISIAGHGTQMKIRMIATKEGFLHSAIITRVFTIDYNRLSRPRMSHAPGSHSQDIQVLLSMPPGEAEGVVIYYTLDDTVPSESSTVYSEPISIAGHGTRTQIRMIAIKEGFLPSEVVMREFTINYNRLSRPRRSHAWGVHTHDIQVLLSMPPGEAEGVVIYYTLDGTIPSESSTVYSEPISIAGHGTRTQIRMIAIKEGFLPSEVVTGTFTINYSMLSRPRMSHTSGSHSQDIQVLLSMHPREPAGVMIYYTLDGTIPSESSILYSGPISILGDGTTITIKTIAIKERFLPSEVVTGRFTIDYSRLLPPRASHTASTYNAPIFVSLNSLEVGTQIRYTRDGTVPTAVNGVVYSTPIQIDESPITIKFYSSKSGYKDSEVVTVDYKLRVAPPVISPDTRYFQNNVTILLTTSTAGATIRYTLDGSEPTSSNGTIYSTGFQIDNPKTVKAAAYKSGWEISSVSSKIYRFSEPLAAPTVTAQTPGQYIRITASGSTNANSYDFYRSDQESGTYSKIATGLTTYNDKNANFGVTYYYKAKAKNPSRADRFPESGFSTAASAQISISPGTLDSYENNDDPEITMRSGWRSYTRSFHNPSDTDTLRFNAGTARFRLSLLSLPVGSFSVNMSRVFDGEIVMNNRIITTTGDNLDHRIYFNLTGTGPSSLHDYDLSVTPIDNAANNFNNKTYTMRMDCCH